jgi:hypothetical protein
LHCLFPLFWRAAALEGLLLREVGGITIKNAFSKTYIEYTKGRGGQGQEQYSDAVHKINSK